MWTKAPRQRVVEQRKKRPRYPTDLNDDEWVLIHPFLPLPAKTGRPREVDLREVLDAIRIWQESAAVGTCCQTTFRRLGRSTGGSSASCRRLLFQTINDVALMLDRERSDREASPSGGILDSQTVKAPRRPREGL
jgi:transposase